MEDYLNNIFKDTGENIKLDEEQKKVVLDDSKNIIVVAGAGAGKTTVITAKVKYLIEKKNINPKDILIISFTNKATNELKDRINNVFKLDVDISTFHSFAFKIIRKFNWGYDLISDYNFLIRDYILKSKDTRKLIKLLKKDKVYRKESKRYKNDIEYFIIYTAENFNLYRMNSKKDIDMGIFSKYYVYLENILLFIKEYQYNYRFTDYEDLIILSKEISKAVNISYKYIIVDEFQDISLNRYLLLKKICSIYNIKMIVVGDDWQAIYSFAGSDNNLFLNFKKDMNATIHKITSTYRNSNELIKVAGSFIMENKKQIIKELKSNKSLKYPIIICYYIFNPSYKMRKIIDEIIKNYGKEKSILILSRYKKDINIVLGDYFSLKEDTIIYKKSKDTPITHLTIHASKGLGYDNVILLINKDNSFPSNREDSFIRKSLLPKEDKILEERRLFYVAMTRTKNNFYILDYYFKESIFTKEIKNKENVLIKNKKSK